jgi:hypothetical protein
MPENGQSPIKTPVVLSIKHYRQKSVQSTAIVLQSRPQPTVFHVPLNFNAVKETINKQIQHSSKARAMVNFRFAKGYYWSSLERRVKFHWNVKRQHSRNSLLETGFLRPRLEIWR